LIPPLLAAFYSLGDVAFFVCRSHRMIIAVTSPLDVPHFITTRPLVFSRRSFFPQHFSLFGTDAPVYIASNPRLFSGNPVSRLDLAASPE